MFAPEIIEFDDVLGPRFIKRYLRPKGLLKKVLHLFRWACEPLPNQDRASSFALRPSFQWQVPIFGGAYLNQSVNRPNLVS